MIKIPFKTKDFYLNNWDIEKSRVFKNKSKLNKLIKLAKTNKYSIVKLCKIFKCNNKAIFRVLYAKGIVIPNLGKFKKKYFCNERFFTNLNPISTYWAGFIAADGCLHLKGGKQKYIYIVLNKKDIGHINKFIKTLNSNHKINHVKSNNSVGINILSNKLFDSLLKLNITPNKSLKINKINISKFYSHFIRGVFDGDGSISGNKKSHIQLCIAGNKPFLEWIQSILTKKCNLNNKVKIYPLQNKVYRLQYTGSQIFRILDYLYNDSIKENRLDRKYDKYLKFNTIFR